MSPPMITMLSLGEYQIRKDSSLKQVVMFVLSLVVVE